MATARIARPGGGFWAGCTRWLRQSYLTRCSSPASDRPIYRAITRGPVRRILEVGMGQLVRSRRLIELALLRAGEGQIEFVGIDQFEARSEPGSGMALKAAHCLLSRLPAKVRLLPGDAQGVIQQRANTLGQFDLVVISADSRLDESSRSWFYLPRMLATSAQVFLEPSPCDQKRPLVPVPVEEIHRRAAQYGRRRAA